MKRYSPITRFWTNNNDMIETPDGIYVRYIDVEAEIARVRDATIDEVLDILNGFPPCYGELKGGGRGEISDVIAAMKGR